MASRPAPWIRITIYREVASPVLTRIGPRGCGRGGAGSLHDGRRRAVLAAVMERCSNREWVLAAAHVRMNHVHLIIDAEVRPERVMNDLKSFTSRRLNELGFDEANRKRWARHGSTRWLWKREAVLAAIEYVVDKQGEKMAVYEK